MIPHIQPLPSDGTSRGVERSAFTRGPKERPLRVWLDVDALAGDEIADRIRGFRTHEYLAIRELSLSQITVDSEGGATLTESTAANFRQTFFGPAKHNLEALAGWGVPVDTVADPGIELRLILAMFAERGDGCDALVTSSAQLLQIAPKAFPGSNVMPPASALAAIGLHLRLREDFVYRHFDGGRVETGGQDFYSMLAHGVLHEWWRWSSLCPRAADPLKPSAGGLAEAIHVRVTRMLRARDRLHGQLLRVPTPESTDEALLYFDSFLVALAGAFDCAARVADQVYAVHRPREASWRKPDWVQRVKAEDPSLASLVAPAAEVRDCVDVIFLLRNTVHEETLTIVGIVGSSERIESYQAAVPQSQRDALLACATRLGGAAAWGLHTVGDEALAIDLATYTEQATRRCLVALNALMAAVAVERLGAEREQRRTFGPPEQVARKLPLFLELAGLQA